MGLIQTGFQIEAIEETTPPNELLDVEGMKDEFRSPLMLLVKKRILSLKLGILFNFNCKIWIICNQSIHFIFN